jgi:site-specific DNA-cytosine methylase
VSKAYQQRDAVERQNALSVVEWYVKFAAFSSATSWSMEQVATPVVIECLHHLKKCLSRARFDYEVIDFVDIGVPQHRKRVIAGSSDVVSRVRRLARWRQSVKDVVPFPRATHLRTYMMNSNPKPDPTGRKKWVYKRYSDDDACKPITDPAPTVKSRHFFRWAFPNTGSKLVLFSVEEMASLQTFPPGYSFGDKKRKAMRCIGNALPPLAMQQILSGRKPSGQRTKKRRVLADPASPSYDRGLHVTFEK